MPKPKRGDKNPQRDRCQTPYYALGPLKPYINKSWRVWESATGEGYLSKAISEFGVGTVICTDILSGTNYFDYEPTYYDVQITNPPFSLKYLWLERAYQLGKPFALLMPIDVLGSGKAQGLFSQYGLELILMDKRVDYKMPLKGWGGSAQFNSAWFTWKFNIGRSITYTKLVKEKMEE